MTRPPIEQQLAEAIRQRAEHEPVTAPDIGSVLDRPPSSSGHIPVRRPLLAAAAAAVVLAAIVGVLVQQNAQRVDTIGPPPTSARPPAPETSELDRPFGSDIDDEQLEHLRRRLFGSSVIGTRLFPRAMDPEADRALHDEHEQVLTRCMADQGFEYLALPFTEPDPDAIARDSLDDQTYANQYGLGISTTWEAEELQSAVVAATETNPNIAIVAAMTQAEQAAYNLAKLGPEDADARSEDGSYRPADRTAGCSGQAARTYGGLDSMDLPDEARTDIMNLEARLQTAPAVRDARTTWTACMADAGYNVAAREQMPDLVNEWLTPVLATPATRPETVTDASGNSITVEVPDLDQQALSEVQDSEIELAIADRNCDAESRLSELTAQARTTAQTDVIKRWQNELPEAN